MLPPFLFLSRRPRRRIGTGLLLSGALFLAGAPEPDPDDPTVACWRFDEPADSPPGTMLRDSGPRGLDAALPAGGRLVPGRSGRALRVPRRPDGTAVPGQPPRPPGRNPTDSALNLGEGAWTVEGWLRLDATAREEGVILEIATSPDASVELVTRISVLPRDDAFVFSGLAPAPEDPAAPLGRLVEFPDPSGPPGGTAVLFTCILTSDTPLPRARWFHAALVHAAAGELRLFIDGLPCAVARAPVRALPRGDAATFSLGSDGRGGRPFPGELDDLRVSARAMYSTRFDPAEEKRRPAGP